MQLWVRRVKPSPKQITIKKKKKISEFSGEELGQDNVCVVCHPYLSLSSNEICTSSLVNCGTSPVAQMVKNLPAMQENWIQVWVRTHSSVLA